MTNPKFPYYSINKLLWRWKRHDDACWIVPDVALSLDRPPPDTLCVQPSPPAPPKPPRRKPEVGDTLLAMMDAHSRFKTWLNTPDPPKPPKPAPTPKQPQVPPFDIQEIPGAMRKEMMPVAAKLMERWFAGELNYGRTDDDTKAEINQRGEPYPSSMYDMTTVKLDWALKPRRAREQYDYLISSAIRTPKAKEQLGKILGRYKRPGVKLDVWVMCGENLRNLHRHFQFTFARVGSTLAQKITEDIDARFHSNGVPDDLNGALGSFNLYAAPAYVTFDVDGRFAEVSGIYVYIKDSYDFTDKAGQISQYLGHWSKDGIIVLDYNGFVGYLNRPELYRAYAVTMGDPSVKGNVYYPVHNSDFREWAIKHQRGGDFVVYSDYRFVPIYPPMKVWL
ncbi:hypothetical protein KY49_3280 [Burkholderia sp. MSHR3999]|uniref:DUF6402 family protein n=1 Tax=Burkholderia sp. MSHR3999 TaxID=1542965 RepID=UPI0005B7522D|nr:DUF6402 family protein [Burkholderia sp. MSHR3999]KIP19798.1 hypothetical protein KY49_3280 [Burkholderia sp. MSHR3999]